MRLGIKAVLSAAGLAAALFVAGQPRAEACGCFTPPDPSTPIVQGGEKIAFVRAGGIVTAIIQVQYQGPASEFGWLLPLPSEPTLELSTDEVFAQLVSVTQPKYKLNREYNGACPFDPSNPGNFGAGGPASGGDAETPPADPGSPLVVQDSIGPYDYAVLRADSQQPMLDWLNANHYYVPTATADAVTPYIHSGAFFLALKLRKGNDAGDLQPVVVKYASDLPMIPIVLTGVGAADNMPVMVWMLGDHRAIPRNYYHTLINDAAVDWLNFGANYVDVVTKAVDEADGHHSFVTEYAGTTAPMQNLLDYPGRFGVKGELRQLTNPQDYMNYLSSHGFGVYTTTPSNPFGGLTFNSQTLAILQNQLPVPPEVIEQGVSPTDYYLSIDYWAQWMRDNWSRFPTHLDLTYDPVTLTDALWTSVVEPDQAAGKLFTDNPYMTRLFTTLSPAEMTRDPVFSFNPDLPDVSNVKNARLIYRCGFAGYDDITKTPATLITEEGWSLALPNGTQDNPWLDVVMPASLEIQILGEIGPAQTVVDNHGAIVGAIDGVEHSGGCAVAPSGRLATGLGFGLAGLGLMFAAFVIGRRRR